MSDAELSSLTQCPQCKQTFADPQLLPCLDTLCKKCFFTLAATVSTADASQQVRKCPSCSTEVAASGKQLKPDSRTSWIVRTRQAEAERQKKESAKGRCSLPHCVEAAVSKGYYFEGTLCASHVKTDADKFAEIKLTAQSLLESVRGLTQKRKDALADLVAERADSAELLDVLEARLQRCRQATLGRLDSAIDKLKLELRAVEFIEKLQIEIQDAERVGDQVLSSRLFKQLHLSLADVDVKAGWASSAAETVELLQHLIASVNVLAADVENGKGLAYSSGSLENREPVCQEFVTKGGVAPSAVAVCTCTDGYYGNPETGVVSKQCQAGMQPLPPRCILAVGKKEAGGGYFAAAPAPRELFVQFYDVFGRFCGQFSIDFSPRSTLVAAECSSGLQRLFLLVNGPDVPAPNSLPTRPSVMPDAPPPAAEAAAGPEATQAASRAVSTTAVPTLLPPAGSPSHLIVTDLAGGQLYSLFDLQVGGPARALTCCGDHLSSACIYVLGNGLLTCLAAESGQILESIPLVDEVKEARSIAGSGRRLTLLTSRSVFMLNPATKAAPARVVALADKDPDLKRAISIGCGFVAAADGATKWICFTARTGIALRAYKGGPGDTAACVARLESGLRIFALKK